MNDQIARTFNDHFCQIVNTYYLIQWPFIPELSEAINI